MEDRDLIYLYSNKWLCTKPVQERTNSSPFYKIIFTEDLPKNKKLELEEDEWLTNPSLK